MATTFPVQITANERLLAERYYLKRYASRWAGSRGNDGPEMTFAAEHPRYNHLVSGKTRKVLPYAVYGHLSLCVCVHTHFCMHICVSMEMLETIQDQSRLCE